MASGAPTRSLNMFTHQFPDSVAPPSRAATTRRISGERGRLNALNER